MLFPQVLKNVRRAGKNASQDSAVLKEAVRAAEEKLAGQGRVLLRPSGTEPLLRVMVEGEDAALVETLALELARIAAM